MDKNQTQNPLGHAPVGKLMVKFAVPSIVAMLVSALYNIVDQLFIGQAVGTLGNAATNIAFPLSTSCVALALMFGIGGASSFNLAMGRKEPDKAAHYIGNSIVLLLGSGILLMIITLLFLTPMLRFFGSPDDVLGYAKTYVGITAFGFPFLILTTGGGHLIRADGNPKMTMICNLSGAVINTILDAVFVFGFDMGMAGAAYATIIGQIFSGILVINYMRHCKTVKITKKQLKLKWEYSARIISLGTASFFNQIAMMVVQIVLNKSLKHYGSLSAYGEAIPLACVGIISKVNMVFFSIVIGIAQGTQPIEGYNYGAGNFKRVKEAYRLATIVGGAIAVVFFILFQSAPRQIISLFGK
nr:MATE family efflux transporter [Anaerosporobacter sp.]